MRYLSIKFILEIKIIFLNGKINKSGDFWTHVLWQMRLILMALALSGQMGLICSIVDSRDVKKLLVIKIYEYRVRADEVPACCYLQFNTSSPWIIIFFKSCGLFWDRREQKDLEDRSGVRLCAC